MLLQSNSDLEWLNQKSKATLNDTQPSRVFVLTHSSFIRKVMLFDTSKLQFQKDLFFNIIMACHTQHCQLKVNFLSSISFLYFKFLYWIYCWHKYHVIIYWLNLTSRSEQIFSVLRQNANRKCSTKKMSDSDNKREYENAQKTFKCKQIERVVW